MCLINTEGRHWIFCALNYRVQYYELVAEKSLTQSTCLNSDIMVEEVRSRVQKFPAWHKKPRQMENAVRDI